MNHRVQIIVENTLKANDLKLIVGGNNLTEAYQAIQVIEGTQVFI